MLSRRSFIKINGVTTAGLSLGLKPAWFEPASPNFESRRPKAADRKFSSTAVEDLIGKIKPAIADPEIAWMFENCYPNTLDTTVKFSMKDGKPDTFVITGDIDAMWLRDSSAQVWPYLPLINQDAGLKQMVKGVLNRQAKYILIDPYANAFNEGPTGSEWDTDRTAMKPELHERKWEIDSLCYPIRLAYRYWKITGDNSFFDDNWQQAGVRIIQTFEEQQRFKGQGPYHFQRRTEVSSDTAPLGGYGNPVKPNGLICSIFRPSDDATLYPFLIPSNFFAYDSLGKLAEMYRSIAKDDSSYLHASELSKQVGAALLAHAKVIHPIYGTVYAYETDGFGNHTFMDDANVPGLLSMAYLEESFMTDPVYQNTRRMVLSEANPYFFKGTAAEGIGGPHVGLNYIWPMSIIIRALTSTNKSEILTCLHTLKRTHAHTGFMHESFNKDNPEDYTRKWFAWANTLFGELIIKIYHNYPDILNKT